MKRLLALACLLGLAAPVFAWNARAHSVVSRLAWRQLTDDRRAKVVAVLKRHPHYDEYLAANRPVGFTEDEWAFLRASTWADWVRGNREYDRPVWHYVNYPLVPPGSAVKAADHEPAADQANIVKQLPLCAEKVRSGSDVEKAVHLTWLFHLVGDIHQPLHCTAVFSEQFPRGDQGGNLAFIRIRTSPVKLHAFWDGLLGTGTTAGNIGSDVREIEAVLKERGAEVRKELAEHPTFESWAREGAALSRRVAYLDGALKVAASTSPRVEPTADVPTAPDGYAQACGRVARVQVGKAGLRLAGLLTELFPPAGGPALEVSPSDPAARKVVLIGGSNRSKPGEHEYLAGCAALADLLRQTPGVAPVLTADWPTKPQTLLGAAAVVFFFDGGPKHAVLTGDRAAQVQRLVDAGAGLVQLHQAADYPKDFGDRARGWAGAAWELGHSKRAHWVADFRSFPPHPVFRGVTPFKIDDGWLYRLRFAPGGSGVTPLLRTEPPGRPQESPAGDDLVVAWAYERPGGGRSFSFTGGHLHRSLAEAGYRRFLVNGILWAAGMDVPAAGAPVALTAADLTNYLTQRPGAQK